MKLCTLPLLKQSSDHEECKYFLEKKYKNLKLEIYDFDILLTRFFLILPIRNSKINPQIIRKLS